MQNKSLITPFKFPYERIGWRVMNLLRYYFSYLPKVGFIRSPPNRPNGISAVVRSCNDEWIEFSLRSIKDFADEIIVVDASTDDTPAKVMKLAEKEIPKIRLIHLSLPLDMLMGEHRNLHLSL